MAKKKKFPDLTGDGKVTRADVLKGRGVFNDGGKTKKEERKKKKEDKQKEKDDDPRNTMPDDIGKKTKPKKRGKKGASGMTREQMKRKRAFDMYKNGGKSKTREKVDGGTVTKTKKGDATITTKRRADGSLIKGKVKTKDAKLKQKYRKDGTLKKTVTVTRDKFGSKVRRTTKMDKKGKVKRTKRIGGSPQNFQGDGFERYAFGGVAPKLGTAKKFPSDSSPFEAHLSKFYRSNK